MKKIIIFLFFSLLLSCNSVSPSSVAEKFLIAVEEGNFEEAKKYADSDTMKLIDWAIDIQKKSGEKSLKKEKSHKKYNFRTEKIDEDNVLVFFKSNNSEKEDSLHMTRIDNQWKVSMKKEDKKEKSNKKDENS